MANKKRDVYKPKPIPILITIICRYSQMTSKPSHITSLPEHRCSSDVSYLTDQLAVGILNDSSVTSVFGVTGCDLRKEN